MPGQTFYSDNDSGTMADVLKAVGLAEVFGAWLGALGRDQTPIMIEDQGTHFQIHLPSPFDDAAMSSIHQPFEVGRAKLLIGKHGDERRPLASWRFEGFPYEEMQANRAAYFERFKKLNEAERADFFKYPEAEEFAELRKLAPHPDLRFYAYINQMKVAGGYNRLLRQWSGLTLEAFHLNLACVLESFAAAPNVVQSAAQTWGKAMQRLGLPYQRNPTRWQLSNPTSGKGEHAAKANKLTIRNLQGFWLLEYLKLVGLFTVGLPLMVAGSKDRKTYVLHPLRAERAALGAVMQAFRQTFFATTAVKLDILAVLRFTRVLVEYLQKALAPHTDGSASLAVFDAHLPIADLARSFEVAFYKDMGSAHAIMNLATINLPSWLRSMIATQEASSVLLLDEHIGVIQSIQNEQGGEGAEELELLQCYREFLSGGEVRWFFDFAAVYGGYVLAKLRRKAWSRPLTTAGMERLMAQIQGKQALAPILENEGFRAVARAIRRATILAQYGAMRDERYPFEVRYSLAQDIRRTAAYPEDFAGALSDFLAAYNAENMRIHKRIKQGSLPNRPEYRRRNLRYEDLHQVVKLADTYSSEVVCRMLVAAGQLLDPARPDQQGATAEEAEVIAPEEELGADEEAEMNSPEEELDG